MKKISGKVFQAFTLVELIVVITIVGILSTIGFVSYSGYLTGARDSNRISQMIKLSDSLQVYGSTKSLPLPDNSVEVTASGTTIAYQGEVGVDVLETIDYTNGGTDPKDDSYYSYMLTRDRKSLQLMAMMEEQRTTSLNNRFTSEGYAANYEDRFPKVYGRKLGILTYNDDSNPTLKNTPLEKISGTTDLDIITSIVSYTANISDETAEKITGTGSELMAMNPEASCKRIKQTGGASGNGTYTISPDGTDFQVYCDMETAGGGWTLVGRSATGSTGNIGWGVSAGSIADDDAHYSLGSITESMKFDTIMASRYANKKDIDYAIKFNVDSDDLNITSPTILPTSNCELVVSSGLKDIEKTWNHCYMFKNWGEFSATDRFMFTHTSVSPSTGLHRVSFLLAEYGSPAGAWHLRQGMIFVK